MIATSWLSNNEYERIEPKISHKKLLAPYFQFDMTPLDGSVLMHHEMAPTVNKIRSNKKSTTKIHNDNIDGNIILSCYRENKTFVTNDYQAAERAHKIDCKYVYIVNGTKKDMSIFNAESLYSTLNEFIQFVLSE